MKTLLAVVLFGFCSQAYAYSTKEFVDEFLTRLEERVIREHASNEKYCADFEKARIYNEFTTTSPDGKRVLYYYYTADLKVEHLLDILNRNFDCYKKWAPKASGSLLGDIANMGAYRKDRKLIRKTLESMVIDGELAWFRTMGEVFGVQDH